MNALHYGDNLERLRSGEIPDGVADLIYLDPPFNSARSYNALFKGAKGEGSPAQIRAFTDTWTYSKAEYERTIRDERNHRIVPVLEAFHGILKGSEMMAYVTMMAPRLLELHAKLKPTGSLYLHCDPVASHYLKLILDVIFGPENFINEITWKRTSAHGDARRKFADVADTLLVYGKTNGYYFKRQFVPHDPQYIREFYRHVDIEGRRYRLDNAASPNPRPNLMYAYKGYGYPALGWRYERATMERLDSEGRLHLPVKPDGSPDHAKRISVKRFLDETEGQLVGCVWSDVTPIGAQAAERRGYPTQKPLALLERIIAASCPEGGTVMDPFCGCGTAVVAAERMGRNWIGIDVTYLAVNEIVNRLATETTAVRFDKAAAKAPKEGVRYYRVLGTPTDEAAAIALFNDPTDISHKEFEKWAVTLVDAKYNPKQGADGGIDGTKDIWDLAGKRHPVVVQVKGGNALTLSAVRDFARVIEREKALIGVMIAQREPTKDMLAEAAEMGSVKWADGREYARYQILTTRAILEDGARADLPSAVAYGHAPDAGVGQVKPGQASLLD